MMIIWRDKTGFEVEDDFSDDRRRREIAYQQLGVGVGRDLITNYEVMFEHFNVYSTPRALTPTLRRLW